MKKARLAVSIVAVLLLVSISASAQESITNVVQKVKPSVVTITTYTTDGKEKGFGTGFFVTESHIITNYHVIEGAARAEVKSATGKVYKVKGVAGSDEIADVARIVLEQPAKGATVLTLSKSVPKEGERVLVVGSPLGLELTVTDGIVSAVRDMPGMGKFIQLTAAISPGSSGSPVVNLKGEVVGVATAYLTEGQSLNFAVSAEHVAKLKSTTVTAMGKVASRTSDKAWEHKSRGFALYWKDEYAKALPHFEAAIKADPDDSSARFALGYCYDELGRYTEAIAAFKQAIRIDPDLGYAHYNLGATYGKLGRYTEAIESCNQAIRIDPDYADAHYNLGLAYLITDNRSGALDQYRILKDLDAVRAKRLFDLIYP